MCMRQQQGCIILNGRGKAGDQHRGWNQSPLTTDKPGAVGVLFPPPLFNPRIAQSHGCVTHMVQDSSASCKCDTSKGGSEPRRGRLRPRLPPTGRGARAPPRAHHVCCSSARTSRATVNKRPGRGPCARPGAHVAETPAMLTALPPPRCPGGKTPLSPSCFPVAGLPGHATGAAQGLFPSPRPQTTRRMSEIESSE